MPGIWPLLVALCSTPTPSEADEPEPVTVVDLVPEDYDLLDAASLRPPGPLARCPSLREEITHLRLEFVDLLVREASGMLGTSVYHLPR